MSRGMKRSDLDQFELVKEDLSVKNSQSRRSGDLVVDVYRDRKNGKFYQVQPPMQGNKYRVTAGSGELADYGDWHKLETRRAWFTYSTLPAFDSRQCNSQSAFEMTLPACQWVWVKTKDVCRYA